MTDVFKTRRRLNMSSNTYKGGLAVGGSALDKSKLLRRPTPDSDVLASSDDDREHVAPVVRPAPGAYPAVRRPSSGWLQDIQRSKLRPVTELDPWADCQCDWCHGRSG